MLIHYIIVRRDLPVGVLAAMTTHAAGESAAVYERSYWNEHEGGPNYGHFEGATAVVLEAKDEKHLRQIASYLGEAKVDYTTVHESGGEYSGQFMAIGVIPAEREDIAEKLRDFSLLKNCLDNPVEAT